MGIFSANIKGYSRSKGQSAVAASAYRSGEKLEERETGSQHDYTKKQGVVYSQIIAPQNISAPDWAYEREALWNAQHDIATRKNACLAREMMMALPHELNDDQRVELARSYAQWIADRHQVMVDFAIHRPNAKGDERNHHMHLMMSANVITDEGFNKAKSYTNEQGERLRFIPFDEGGKRGAAEVTAFREQAAKTINEAYRRADLDLEIDHRSYVDQELSRIPTIHLGKEATGLERRGVETTLGRQNREKAAYNLLTRIKEATPEITDSAPSPAPHEPQEANQPQEQEAGRFRQFFDTVFERARAASCWVKEHAAQIAERFRREEETQLELQNQQKEQEINQENNMERGYT